MRIVMITLLLAFGCRAESNVELQKQVRDAESAFAKTMADRDFTAFGKFLAMDAAFFGDGAKSVLRGRDAVLKGWGRFYEGSDAPFSWAPERVEVLESGDLAISSGPVRDPKGKQVSAFTSVWRREPDGSWKVLYDKGCRACACGQ